MSWFDPWEEIEAVALCDEPVERALARAPPRRSAPLLDARPRRRASSSVDDGETLLGDRRRRPRRPGPHRRRRPRRRRRRRGHLRRQPQHQLHQRLLRELPVLRLHAPAQGGRRLHPRPRRRARQGRRRHRARRHRGLHAGRHQPRHGRRSRYRDVLVAIKERHPRSARARLLADGDHVRRAPHRHGLPRLHRHAARRRPRHASPAPPPRSSTTRCARSCRHKKVDVRTWVEIITTAHRLGMPTTSTVMYGHVETPGHVARHIDLLRAHPEGDRRLHRVRAARLHLGEHAALPRRPASTPQPKGLRDLRMYAVSRLMLRGWIDNLQTSWVKLGHRAGAAVAARRLQRLRRHADGGEHLARGGRRRRRVHLGGGDRGAGARRSGRMPVQRTTLYGRIGEDGAAHADHGAGGWRGSSPLPAGPLASH